MDYGTGAIFGCPAHDQRDLDLARKYDLAVHRVIADGDADGQVFHGDEAYVGTGRLVNSHFLNGMDIDEAKAAVIARAEHEGWGKGTTVWRLRDWGVSRQRYWGTPIPFIHCPACGRSEEHTSELQSLMRISYAVFCLNKTNINK